MHDRRLVSPQTVQGFVQTWFDLISRRAPVEDVLPHLSDDDLEMALPEVTLRGHHDFRQWYEGVGQACFDQTHLVQDLRMTDLGHSVELTLRVRWAGTHCSDGSSFVFRFCQQWLLRRDSAGRLRIARYRAVPERDDGLSG